MMFGTKIRCVCVNPTRSNPTYSSMLNVTTCSNETSFALTKSISRRYTPSGVLPEEKVTCEGEDILYSSTSRQAEYEQTICTGLEVVDPLAYVPSTPLGHCIVVLCDH